MKRVLITGVHGFVGRNLLNSINAGNIIFGLDIISKERTNLIKTYNWDQLEELIGFDVVIHLTGKAHDTKNQSGREEYFEVNTNLTKRVFDFFLQSDAKKFIYFSTVKAVADKVDGVLTEDVTPSPRGPYGESKLAAEQYIISRFQSFSVPEYQSLNVSENSFPEPWNHGTLEHLTGKCLYILRPCMIHGPGNKGNLNTLVSLVRKGIPYPLGAFENRRSYTSIDNLCYVINELINSDIPSGIYNMADDDPVSTNDLVKIIAEATGEREKIWKINHKIINILAATGSFMHLPFNKETLQKLTENYIVSNEKLKKVLGISQMPIDAIEGLRKTLDCMLG